MIVSGEEEFTITLKMNREELEALLIWTDSAHSYLGRMCNEPMPSSEVYVDLYNALSEILGE